MLRTDKGLIEFSEVTHSDSKSEICDGILHALPQWFGIEEAVQDYIQAVRDQDFVAAFDNARPIGFIAIRARCTFWGYAPSTAG